MGEFRYIMRVDWQKGVFNPLNAELNPICHLVELLGAHPILHVSRIRVKIAFLYNWTRRRGNISVLTLS